jgi:type II secretory ATPase GspE/PulE/Tfp pilus assembly ATPase PilB-like protein
MTVPFRETDLDAVQVLDHMVRRAAAMGASDIHVEPKRSGLKVRFRIDGVMVNQAVLPMEIGSPLTNRIKVLARMDLTERRLPQDGQLTLELASGQPIHLRASTFPAMHGETVVLRLMLPHQLIAIERLGMDPADVTKIKRLSKRPAGLILVAGPTGSGKTSTLYAILRIIDTTALSVVTLEDPIEVELPEITQGQTNTKQNFTFATGLRAILRQDPDVILVGEMRDPETAHIALQASLTGHLVLSTLHTADAADTVTRLVDLGVESWIMSNVLLAVIAQRLVRRICEHCVESYVLKEAVLDENGQVLVAAGTTLKRGVGCVRCHQTGYMGRTGIFEVLEVDDELRDVLKTQASKRELSEIAVRRGLVPLRLSGLKRVLAGVTTLEEVLRVT